MRFATPLVPATLIRRYKRFLADVRLEDGREVTAHCPNPGAMTGQAAPGGRIWLEPNDDPRKKLKFGWRLAELPGGGFVCVDTGLPNRVVGEALRAGAVPGVTGEVRSEVAYGAGSRVDFVVGGAFVEVKAVTLRRSGTLAEFPDSVTARGARHMSELAEVVRGGGRAVLLYLLQRDDCDAVGIARDIDPAYAAAFDTARAAGVEVRAHATRIDTGGIALGQAVPVAGG
ncbi:DNA/RNA nuclease SfsA [Jannaschia seohaensis]|uniref:Sugar fermentation stimulation protein homolog n=1 Tax=Jannaschia seohaensis TaxID=475081 RepID=A0A2Y9AT10_9RHOB|nr:DNA/RNA nuclease SfsA [Jannaschia seohaensis]PWJ17451.1 sugar fermentation stimulation protein A [Jannaschia seohaensis]SSA47514.1 sugar fermentation stimulation protein A [Jannaschia seohaensis]